ncbi:DUF7009 family protein [Sanyastnella coralliicola]|uniref:DUF7009 family protein n=1 Tax=Sanyastnella coralliicola TaxID=3069118 RepID=UPI0027BAFF1C|nr:hypothetical protein [Longitalea sp. SCSIO 12813]
MKLRIKGNSIRLRLLQSEVATLAEGGTVNETTSLPGASFSYQLAASEVSKVELKHNTLFIFAQDDQLKSWATSEDVGIYSTLPTENGDLRITIEKDFTCLTSRPNEDETDNYPNPKASH